MPSKLYSGCRQCPYKDSCSNKRMEAHGYLQSVASNISDNISESASSPVMVKHDYRDIKIDASTTVTIDLEDIKKRLVEDFYRSQGIGLMLGG